MLIYHEYMMIMCDDTVLRYVGSKRDGMVVMFIYVVNVMRLNSSAIVCFFEIWKFSRYLLTISLKFSLAFPTLRLYVFVYSFEHLCLFIFS